jgi:hypothetical protein
MHNGACITHQMFQTMILFHDYSPIEDYSNKKINVFGQFLNNIGFLFKKKALSSECVCDATVAKSNDVLVAVQHFLLSLGPNPTTSLFPFILSVPLISSVSLISLSHSQSIAPSLSGQVACRYQFPGLVLSGCVPPAAAVVFLF